MLDNKSSQTLYTIFGLLVLGAGTGTVVVPILVELVSSIKETMGSQGGQQANEKASGLFTMCSALGTILGPIVGGFFYDKFGVHTTCDIFAICSLTMAVLFFSMNIWPGFLINNTGLLKESDTIESHKQALISGSAANRR